MPKKQETIEINNKDYNIREFLDYVKKGLEPVETMIEFNGDMYLSEYRDLTNFYWQITHAIHCLKQGEKND
tara:strand:- start:566 stop:778 length:213 start_codon:yes stop_codon:yes gene_type:complete